ncbi:MAG TPA: CAAX prenyl protease-related protein, partial [Polyangiales bacterium]|nr:CAAX prenyl protease-related protein [Polyangiales bacterium]
LWLIPFGVLSVWFANTLRIALLLAVGVHVSPDIALSGFHSKAGWLFFCAIGLGLIAYAERSPFWNRRAAAKQSVNLTAAYLTPELAILASALVTGLFKLGVLDLWYGVPVLAALAALALYRAHLPKPSWPASFHAPLIGVLGFGIWIGLAPRPDPEDVQLLRRELGALSPLSAAVWYALRILGSCLIVPLAEELAFRAYLVRRLIDADFEAVPKTRLTPLALAGSALAFGLLHGPQWIPATLVGVLYAYAQQVRGRTADAVVAHGVTNALIAVLVLAGGAYWLWV